MSLLGNAVMLLSFNIVPESIDEHDDWHTHEHLPERLSIPGFVRGTRWIALRGRPRYLVMYEVQQLATLTSEAYLERLNNPSAWTSKMMRHYRDMSRGFCSVTASFGLGVGHVALVIQFKPEAGSDASLRQWLLQDALPRLSYMPGLGSVHLLEGAQTPPMTNEQRIRGNDRGVDWAVVLNGYSQGALDSLAEKNLANAQFERQGAAGVVHGTYRLDYSLTDREVDTEPATKGKE